MKRGSVLDPMFGDRKGQIVILYVSIHTLIFYIISFDTRVRCVNNSFKRDQPPPSPVSLYSIQLCAQDKHESHDSKKRREMLRKQIFNRTRVYIF